MRSKASATLNASTKKNNQIINLLQLKKKKNVQKTNKQKSQNKKIMTRNMIFLLSSISNFLCLFANKLLKTLKKEKEDIFQAN